MKKSDDVFLTGPDLCNAIVLVAVIFALCFGFI